MTTQANTSRLKERMQQQQQPQQTPAAGQEKSSYLNAKYSELNRMFEKNLPDMQKMLPAGIPAERMHRAFMTAVRNNPDLLDCNTKSLFNESLKAAQLGLEPDLLGMCYFVAYNEGRNKQKTVRLQIGYRGYIELFYRTGKIAKIEAREVYEKDFFDCEYGSNGFLKHKPSREADKGSITDFYAFVQLANGAEYFEVMSVQQVNHIRDNHSADWKYKKSQGKEHNSIWHKHYAAMGKKTVLHRLKNTLPLSVEDQRNFDLDETEYKDINAEPERIDITDIANESNIETDNN